MSLVKVYDAKDRAKFIHLLPGTGKLISNGCGLVCHYGKDKIIKYTRCHEEEAPKLLRKLRSLIKNPSNHIMKIYECGIFTKAPKFLTLPQDSYGKEMKFKYTCVYYVGEKLLKLPLKDKKCWKKLSNDLLDKEEYKAIAKKASPAILKMLSQVKKLKYIDSHDDNIMMDHSGKLKIIDIDGFFDIANV